MEVTSAGVRVNLFEKLINPSDRSLVDHTISHISQRQKGLSFLCYFLAGIGNKHISSLKKDIAMFLNHSYQAINTLSNLQSSSTSRENQREKNTISSIHRDNVTRDLVKYQTNA